MTTASGNRAGSCCSSTGRFLLNSRPGQRRAFLLVHLGAMGRRRRPLLLLVQDTVAWNPGTITRCLGTMTRRWRRLGHSWILRS